MYLETLNQKPNFLLQKCAKFTHSNVELQNFPGRGGTLGPPFKEEGRAARRKDERRDGTAEVR
jgi:hypothetical protein